MSGMLYRGAGSTGGNMRMRVVAWMVAGLVGAALAGPSMAATSGAPAAARAAPKAVRHPDFSGVWQVMNSANYDLEPHIARAAMQMRPGPVVPVPAKDVLALGAVGAVPSGV